MMLSALSKSRKIFARTLFRAVFALPIA